MIEIVNVSQEKTPKRAQARRLRAGFSCTAYRQVSLSLNYMK